MQRSQRSDITPTKYNRGYRGSNALQWMERTFPTGKRITLFAEDGTIPGIFLVDRIEDIFDSGTYKVHLRVLSSDKDIETHWVTDEKFPLRRVELWVEILRYPITKCGFFHPPPDTYNEGLDEVRKRYLDDFKRRYSHFMWLRDMPAVGDVIDVCLSYWTKPRTSLKMSVVLKSAQRRAAHRAYAPGGIGYEALRIKWDERRRNSDKKRKRRNSDKKRKRTRANTRK